MFEVGDQVGAYTIVRRLGAGGMGEVYLARHRHIGRDAAIKVLLPELSSNDDVVARFFTEARATAAIRHPGIVEILDCDVHKTGRAYIVMEYLDGENLAERLARAGSYANDLPAAGTILAQVASALGAAHARGIVHRDLKPDNVFLCGIPSSEALPTIKILDFGVAKLVVDDGQGRNKTRTGSLLGTPTYMSPEQCRGAGSIDHRTDIYALGCMSLEVLSGKPPFVRDGAGEILVAHLVERPPLLTSLVPHAPQALEALISQMLEKDAAARPGSMAEVLSRLEGIFGVSGSALAPPIEGQSGVMRLPTRAGTTPAIGTPRMTTPAPSGPSATAVPVAAASPVVSGPVIAGGTRVMPAVGSRRGTTLGDTAAEVAAIRDRADDDEAPKPRKRWLIPAIAGGAIGIIALVIVIAASGPSKKPIAAEPPPPPHHETPPPPPPQPKPPAPPAEVTIEIVSEPAGADVWLPGDETPHGKTPLKIAVRRGNPVVNVMLKAEGYNDLAVPLDPGREDSGPINVTLEKAKREHGKHAVEEKHGGEGVQVGQEKHGGEVKHGGDGKHEGKHGKWAGPKDENDIYKPMGD
jgi:serine/threonine-protein kinase